MSTLEIVRRSIEDTGALYEVRNGGVLVTTQCMYPSNSFVQVVVHGQRDEFTVSDDSGVITQLLSVGVSLPREVKRTFRSLVPDGLNVTPRGELVSPVVSRELLGVTIAVVANAAKEIVQWYYENYRVTRVSRDFKTMLARALETTFDDRNVRHHETIVGESNTLHRFENIIALPDGGRAIIDPVLHDVNSINNRLVAHMDVRRAEHRDIEQRLVIDDEEDWSQANLALLSVGAPVVRFSRLGPVLQRLTNRG